MSIRTLYCRALSRSVVVIVTVVAFVTGLLVTFTAPATATTVRVSKVASSLPLRSSPALADALSTQGPPPTVPVEVSSSRTATSDTYQLPDGTYQTRVAAGSINYQDQSGAWQPINNNLTTDTAPGYAAQNTANRYRVELPSTLGTTPVKVSVGSAWVAFALTGASAPISWSTNTATYANALPGVNVSYQVGSDSTAEYLSLASAAAPSQFSFAMTTSPGISLVPAGNGIAITAGGVVVGHLAAPSVSDAAGTAGPVSMSLAPSAAGGTVTLSVDPAWLASAARVFPVTVDPDVSVSTSTACWIDAFVPTTHQACSGVSSVPVAAVNQSGTLYSQRALLQFTLPTSVPADSVIYEAHLAATVLSVSGTGAPLVARRLTQSWDPASTTWNNASTSTAWTTAGGSADGSAVYTTPGYTSQTAVAGSTVDWYPTQLVQDWVSNTAGNGAGIANNGIVIEQSNESVASRVKLDSATSTAPPTLDITYTPRWGEKPSLKYDTKSLNDRTTLEVALGGGNGVLTSNDVAVSGAGLDLNITRYYNSTDPSAPWSFSVGRDVAITSHPDGSVDFSGISGYREPYNFTGTVAEGTCTLNGSTYTSHFFSPVGADATLCQNGSTFILQKHSSGEVLTFGVTANSASGGVYAMSQDIDHNGNTITANYNSSHQLSTIVDTEGRIFTVSYDSTVSKINKIVGPSTGLSRTWTYTWNDSTRNLDSYTDPAGKTTRYYYDANGYMNEVLSPAGSETDLATTNGKVNSITRDDPSCTTTSGKCTTSYAYSATTTGTRCIQWATPGQPVTAPSTMAACTTETDANGNKISYGFDDRDQAVKVIDGNNNAVATTYNPDSQATTLGDSVSTAQSTLNYNSVSSGGTQDRPSSASSPTGATTSFSYGTGSSHPYQPDSAVDAQGNCQSVIYDNPSDPYSNASQTTSGNSGSGCSPTAGSATSKTSYEGDSGVTCGAPTHKNDKCSTTNPNGNVTSYTYDANGNLIKTTPPAPLAATTQTPDVLSRVVTKIDGKGQSTTYAYDSLDRVTKILTNGTSSCTTHVNCTSFIYDADGNLTSRSDVTGTYTFTYDHLNRLTSKQFPAATPTACGTSGDEETFAYDNNSNLTSSCDSGGVVGSTYDAANNLISVFGPGSHSCPTPPASPTNCVRYTYDANHNRTNSYLPGGVVDHATYDNSQRVTSLAITGGPGAINITRNYSYTNGTGGDTALVQSGDQAYTYDALNRLVGATGAGHTYGYSYDGNGNRLTATADAVTTNYAYNAADELCATSAGTPSCAASTYSYDPNGNELSTPSGTSFAYDPKNNTSSITQSGTTTAYTYADIGQAERTASGSSVFDNSPLGVGRQDGTYFTRDNHGGLVAERLTTGTYYYLLDRQGSVIALTNSVGNLADTYSYDPYGNLTASTGTVPNPFRYDSGYQDSTGLYHFGARYYDPTLGRWTQLDPSGQSPEYLYSGDNPVNRTDPSGLDDTLFTLSPQTENAIAIAVRGGATAGAALLAYTGNVIEATITAILGAAVSTILGELANYGCTLSVMLPTFWGVPYGLPYISIGGGC